MGLDPVAITALLKVILVTPLEELSILIVLESTNDPVP